MNYLSILSTGGGLFGSPVIMIVFYCLFIFGAMWLIQRPHKKREQALKELQNNIQIGDSVVLHSGFFGNVVDLADDCVMLEMGTNKTLRVPVLRASIAAKQTADFSIRKTVEDTASKEETSSTDDNVVND